MLVKLHSCITSLVFSSTLITLSLVMPNRRGTSLFFPFIFSCRVERHTHVTRHTNRQTISGVNHWTIYKQVTHSGCSLLSSTFYAIYSSMKKRIILPLLRRKTLRRFWESGPVWRSWLWPQSQSYFGSSCVPDGWEIKKNPKKLSLTSNRLHLHSVSIRMPGWLSISYQPKWMMCSERLNTPEHKH